MLHYFLARVQHASVCLLISLLATSTVMPAPFEWTNLGNGTFRDETGLQWTREDNGRDVNWKAAQKFCAEKSAGWRLPAVEELERLYHGAVGHQNTTRCGSSVCRAPESFKLSGSWFWSSTPAGIEKDDGLPDIWGVLLVNGARTAALGDIDFGARTLCVR